MPLPENLTPLAEIIFALALNKRHDYEGSAKILGDVLASGGLPEAATSKAALHRLYGLDLYLSGNYGEAVAQDTQALRLDTNDVVAQNNLGIAYDAEGQHEAAIAEFKRALKLKPDDAVAHNNLGIPLYAVGQHEAAIAEYQAAIQLTPDYAEAHYNLGNVLEAVGQHNAAIAEFKEALTLRPDYAARRTSTSAMPSMTRASTTPPSPSIRQVSGSNSTTPCRTRNS